MSPLVSVIIPAFEMEGCVAEAVTSVLQQTMAAAEIVIASDDGRDYIEILAKQGIYDKRLRCISTGGYRTGLAKARNTALRAARFPIIAPLDADDLLHPTALEKLAPLAEKFGAIYSDIHFVKFEDGTELTNYNRPMPEGLLNLEAILTSNVHGYAWLVTNRERLPNISYFEEIPIWEDVLFLGECCNHLGHIYHHPDHLYIYRRRDGSLCNQPDAGHQFNHWAKYLVNTLLNDPSRFALTPYHRDVLYRYFQSRINIEEKFIHDSATERNLDYLKFMQDNLPMFYTLEP